MAYTLLVIGILVLGLRGIQPGRRSYAAIAVAAAAATVWMLR